MCARADTTLMKKEVDDGVKEVWRMHEGSNDAKEKMSAANALRDHMFLSITNNK